MKKDILRVLVIFFLALNACTKSSSSSDDDDSGDDGNPVVEGEFRTDCGVVIEDELVNPVRAKDAQTGSVEVTGTNQVIFRTGSKSFLVKLHGLRQVSDFRRDLTVNRLRDLTKGQMLFFQTSKTCTTSVDGGGTAFVGQLFNASGRSVNETLLDEGLSDTDFGDSCFSELITTCYDALEEDGQQFGGVVSKFLWKPVAERDGNLVVLLDPSDTQVVVAGQNLRGEGPSNGFGQTARISKPGCAFGSNVQVQVFDSDGRIFLFPGGAREYRIPNGCDRVEF